MTAKGDPGTGDPGWLPPHRYVPGATPRHPEGLFDVIRQTAHPGMTAAELRRSAAWRDGLRFLEAGYSWEAHEVMEAVWLCLPDGPERRRVQAVIQLANAELKAAMAKPRAVARLAEIVRDLVRTSASPEAEAWLPADAITRRLHILRAGD